MAVIPRQVGCQDQQTDQDVDHAGRETPLAGLQDHGARHNQQRNRQQQGQGNGLGQRATGIVGGIHLLKEKSGRSNSIGRCRRWCCRGWCCGVRNSRRRRGQVVVKFGMQDDPGKQGAQHNEDDGGRDIGNAPLQPGYRHREQQRQNQNQTVGQVGDKTLHRAEAEGGQHIADQEQVHRAQQRTDDAATPARQTGTAQHQRSHSNQRVGRALGGVTRSDQGGVSERSQRCKNTGNTVRAEPDDGDANPAGIGGTFVRAHEAQVAVKSGAGEDQPSSGAEHQNDQNRGIQGGAQTPGRHPLRRRTARARQYHQIDARQGQVPAERHDDGLHPHIHNDQRHQQLVGNTHGNGVQKEGHRRLQRAHAAEHHQGHVDETHQGSDRQIDRAAPGNRQRHQGIGRQRQWRQHNHGAADARR